LTQSHRLRHPGEEVSVSIESRKSLDRDGLLDVLSAVTGLVGQIVARAASLFVVSGVIFGAAMVGGAGFCWCSAIAIAGTLVIVGFLRVGSGDFSLSYDHSDQAAA